MQSNLYVQLAQVTVIETPRLLLRPASLADTEDLYEYASNPTNLTYIFPVHFAKSDSRFFIANYFMKAPLGKWFIELKASHKMIGSIQFTKLDPQNLTAELGYVLNQTYWRQGFMSEALSNLTEISFYKLGLKKLLVKSDSQNIASIRTAQKVGFAFVKSYKASNQYVKNIREFRSYQLTAKDWKEKYEQT